jgi:hypothetical protein
MSHRGQAPRGERQVGPADGHRVAGDHGTQRTDQEEDEGAEGQRQRQAVQRNPDPADELMRAVHHRASA